VNPAARQTITDATGAAVTHVAPLTGGCIGDVWRVDLADGRRMVAKTASTDGALDIEGYMLDYLARTRTIPVPEVIHAEPGLLIMEYVETSGRLDTAAQEHAADLLAALHDITADAYGHERDTLIGSLRQPNPWTESWLEFFGDQRLIHMGRLALDNGSLPRDVYARLEKFRETKLETYIDPASSPSLIHGDMWGGNVLVRGGHIAAFIDPAIYHGDAEIELAFATLFNTYGDPFFRRYNEHRPIRTGFFEARRDIYNLYPLLTHTRYFGRQYAVRADGILRRSG